MKHILFLANRIHYWLFKDNLSEEGEKFINNLSLVFFATIFAKFLMFIVQTWGGRILGPEKYGEVNLIISIGSILIIPITIFLGGSGLILYYQKEKEENNKKRLISSVILAFFFMLPIVMFIMIILSKYISYIFQTNQSIILLSALFTFFSVLMTFAENIFKSLNLFKDISIATISSNLLLLIAFWILVGKNNTPYLILIPLLISQGGYFIFSIKPLLNNFIFCFEKKMFVKVISYNWYLLISAVSGIFLSNIDKIMLNMYFGTESVGLYQAYFYSSTIIIGTLIAVFITVFFPLITKIEDKREVFRRMNKFSTIITPLIAIILLPITYIIIKYVYQYPIFGISLMLSIISAAFLPLNMVYATLLSSYEKKGIKEYFKGNLLQTLINIGLNLVLIPKFYITGAILATLISCIGGYIYFHYTIYLLERKAKNET